MSNARSCYSSQSVDNDWNEAIAALKLAVPGFSIAFVRVLFFGAAFPVFQVVSGVSCSESFSVLVLHFYSLSFLSISI